MPITVARTYDTLDNTESGDLGYGWTLEISNTSLSISNPQGTDNALGNGAAHL